MSDLPSAVLFACTMNSIRSPIAEGILKFLHGHKIYVDSVGVYTSQVDEFAVSVMDEIGIDLSRHKGKKFDDLEDNFYDVVISLSPEAQHRAVELTRLMSVELEYWNVFDPSIIVSDRREPRLLAYRQVRDQLMDMIKKRFPVRRVYDT